MSRLLYRLGHSAARHPWRVLGAWLLALMLLGGLAASVGGALNDNFTLPGTGAQRATDLLREKFPAMSGADARIVAHDDGPVDAVALASTAARVWALPHVTGVSPPVFSKDGRIAVINVQYDVPVTELADGVTQLERASTPLRHAGVEVDFGGQLPENIQRPDGRAESVGFLAALVILLIAFGSVIAAGLPLATAAIGLVAGSAGITLLAAVMDVAKLAPTMATMIGIGVGIDYALFVLTRHRDGLSAGLPVAEAAARANATAGQSVVFAGGTVLLAMGGLAFCGVPNFATMGYATAIVVAFAVIAAITLLPALFGLLQLRVFSRRARRSGRLEASASHSAWAARLAERVGRRPWPWLAAALVVLFALAAPALSMRIGQADAGNEPTSNTTRRAYDLVADAFGPGANGPLLVAVDLGKTPAAELGALRADIAATQDVAAVSAPVISPDQAAAVLTVTPKTAPQEQRTVDLVNRLRDGVLPEGADVTGVTAAFIDLSDVLSDHLPLVIGVVLATSLVLLTIAFRSVVVSIKAAVVNLISIAAAYGVMTLAFQTEAGAKLMGLPGEVPIAAYVPMFMFAILFGLSMDYEVFLLASIREHWLRTGSPRASVVSGLAGTARVISSAALIMVAVFLGFALDPSVVVKMVGVGLAAAIAIDATLVRLVLVPATMALLGRWTWYLPRWLDRILPRLDPHGVDQAPDRERAAGQLEPVA